MPLGDVFMRAFPARRQHLRESNPAMGPLVIGTRHSQETFRRRDFLARNRMPFSWPDPEADPGAKRRLAWCGLTDCSINLRQRSWALAWDSGTGRGTPRGRDVSASG